MKFRNFALNVTNTNECDKQIPEVEDILIWGHDSLSGPAKAHAIWFSFLSLLHHIQAYKQGYYGAKYVWLLIGWYQSRWWEAHSAHASKIQCKTKHVTEAFGNYITTAFRKIGPSSPDIIGGEVTDHNLFVFNCARKDFLAYRISQYSRSILWFPAQGNNVTR